MEEFKELFCEALEIYDREIDINDRFRDYEEWDSLAVLSILAEINESYGIIIPRQEFEKLITIEDLYLYIKENTSGK
jgi:acyl carrier protein